MNRLIRIMLSFVLPFFCLLINVSYGVEFGSTSLNCNWTNGIEYNSSSYILTSTSYRYSDAYTIINNYLSDTSNDTYVTNYETMISTLELEGLDIIIFNSVTSNNTNTFKFLCFPNNLDVGFLVGPDNVLNFCFVSSTNDTFSAVTYGQNITRPWDTIKGSVDGIRCTYGINSVNIYYSSLSIKQLTGTYTSVTWDGTSYFYKVESEEPESPSLPTNAEIAQAVQAFYNSDYYKNNKDFSDFMVLYNTTNGNYSFIGHTLGNVLGQVIIPPDYRFEGKLYSEQWWKFYIDENQGATPYASTFHLYSIINTALDVISDDGVGKISELVNLDFSSKSVIVYSTTNYPVRTYMLDETTGDYIYTDGIIEGDQYTYDENLDPTISGYNPLDNFVTVDPSQTIIGDADFEGFTDVFEENKDLFSFTENMQWLIKANNKLFNYFLGFIVMCALFITLGRVLRG